MSCDRSWRRRHDGMGPATLLRLVGQLCFVNVVGGEVSSTERVLVGKSVTEIGSARLRLRAARFVWSEAASV